jgi:hypothetical protein
MSATTAILLQASARIAIHLLVHASDVECAGRGRNADENRQGNQGGYDGLHGSMLQTMRATQLSPVIDGRKHCILSVICLFPAEQAFEEGEFPTAHREQPERALK